MRYIVVQQENKEPIVLLWIKSQRPNLKDRDYPHTTYIKDNKIALDTISSAGYVYYNPETQQSDIDDVASYQMDNHEGDRDRDFNLVRQALPTFCLTHRNLVSEVKQEWIERQDFLKRREEILKRMAEIHAGK